MSDNLSVSLATPENMYIAPVADVIAARVRYQLMKDFVESILHQDVDFGIIPGTNKPTLYKPGAEKLSSFFGLTTSFAVLEKELDWSGATHGEPFFYFHYRCSLTRAGMLVAEAEGSCNSWEKKYRYRDAQRTCPNCGQPTIFKSKPPRTGFYCWQKKGGCGATFGENDRHILDQEQGQVKNPDIADLVNTLQKMAQKRAFVAAVLIAVNGSEYFTQDVEDFIDGTYSPVVNITNDDKEKTATRAESSSAPNDPVGEIKTMFRVPSAEDQKPVDEKPNANAGIVHRVPHPGLRAKIGNNQYPAQWARLFAAYTRADRFEVDGILQELKLPDDTRPEHVVDAVNKYLDAKAVETKRLDAKAIDTKQE